MRIYNVTLTRELQCTIAAENEQDLEKALQDAQYEIDDWNPSDWEWTVYDPLKQVKTVGDLNRYPDSPKEPDMVVDRGTVLALDDVDVAEVIEKIEETIRAHKAKIAFDAVQMKIPGIA
jgi:hypothetical protein